MKTWYPKPEAFSASKDGCDVRMGPYRFTGDLHEYHITAAAEDLSVDIKLEGTTESWRPETGHLLFGPNDEHLFAWTPFVPFGKVTGTYKIGDEVHEATGRAITTTTGRTPTSGTSSSTGGGREARSARTRSSQPTSSPWTSTVTGRSTGTCWPATASRSRTMAPR